MNKLILIIKKMLKLARENLVKFVNNNTFNKIGSEKYWSDHYAEGGNSGEGSYGTLAIFKAKIVNDLIESEGIHSIIELGCGDGNQLSLYRLSNYYGIDVHEPLLAYLRKRFPNFKFSKWNNDILSNQWDLSMSIDVIYHLVSDEEYLKYMRRLFDLSNKWVIVYSSNFESNQQIHVRHRKFLDWVKLNRKDFVLKKVVNNFYPEQSSANFFIFKKIID